MWINIRQLRMFRWGSTHHIILVHIYQKEIIAAKNRSCERSFMRVEYLTLSQTKFSCIISFVIPFLLFASSPSLFPVVDGVVADWLRLWLLWLLCSKQIWKLRHDAEIASYCATSVWDHDNHPESKSVWICMQAIYVHENATVRISVFNSLFKQVILVDI
jgi:hypothetical protein